MAQYTEVAAAKKNSKTIEVTLQLDAADMEKLKGSPMSAWVMGEGIAQELIKGNSRINVNLKDMFCRHRV
jgi:hypothetical protein